MFEAFGLRISERYDRYGIHKTRAKLHFQVIVCIPLVIKTCVLLKPQAPQTHVGRDQLKRVMFCIDATIKDENAQRNERLRFWRKETQNPFSDSFGFKNPILDFLEETHE